MNLFEKRLNNAVFIGTTTHVGIADEGGDLYVLNDVEIGGDLSIAGDTTIAGVIFGDDHTEITGSLTTDMHLDVRGLIFDGADIDIDIAEEHGTNTLSSVYNDIIEEFFYYNFPERDNFQLNYLDHAISGGIDNPRYIEINCEGETECYFLKLI